MTKSPVKSFRLNPDLVLELEKESKAQHRTLSNYVEYLLITHQSRGGGLKKATNKRNKQSGDAENAEMAQCAEIDARLAYQKAEKLEKQMYNQQYQKDYEMQQKVDFLMSKVDELENRLNKLSSSGSGV